MAKIPQAPRPAQVQVPLLPNTLPLNEKPKSWNERLRQSWKNNVVPVLKDPRFTTALGVGVVALTSYAAYRIICNLQTTLPLSTELPSAEDLTAKVNEVLQTDASSAPPVFQDVNSSPGLDATQPVSNAGGSSSGTPPAFELPATDTTPPADTTFAVKMQEIFGATGVERLKIAVDVPRDAPAAPEIVFETLTVTVTEGVSTGASSGVGEPPVFQEPEIALGFDATAPAVAQEVHRASDFSSATPPAVAQEVHRASDSSSATAPAVAQEVRRASDSSSATPPARDLPAKGTTPFIKGKTFAERMQEIMSGNEKSAASGPERRKTAGDVSPAVPAAPETVFKHLETMATIERVVIASQDTEIVLEQGKGVLQETESSAPAPLLQEVAAKGDAPTAATVESQAPSAPLDSSPSDKPAETFDWVGNAKNRFVQTVEQFYPSDSLKSGEETVKRWAQNTKKSAADTANRFVQEVLEFDGKKSLKDLQKTAAKWKDYYQHHGSKETAVMLWEQSPSNIPWYYPVAGVLGAVYVISACCGKTKPSEKKNGPDVSAGVGAFDAGGPAAQPSASAVALSSPREQKVGGGVGLSPRGRSVSPGPSASTVVPGAFLRPAPILVDSPRAGGRDPRVSSPKPLPSPVRSASSAGSPSGGERLGGGELSPVSQPIAFAPHSPRDDRPVPPLVYSVQDVLRAGPSDASEFAHLKFDINDLAAGLSDRFLPEQIASGLLNYHNDKRFGIDPVMSNDSSSMRSLCVPGNQLALMVEQLKQDVLVRKRQDPVSEIVGQAAQGGSTPRMQVSDSGVGGSSISAAAPPPLRPASPGGRGSPVNPTAHLSTDETMGALMPSSLRQLPDKPSVSPSSAGPMSLFAPLRAIHATSGTTFDAKAILGSSSSSAVHAASPTEVPASAQKLLNDSKYASVEWNSFVAKLQSAWLKGESQYGIIMDGKAGVQMFPSAFEAFVKQYFPETYQELNKDASSPRTSRRERKMSESDLSAGGSSTESPVSSSPRALVVAGGGSSSSASGAGSSAGATLLTWSQQPRP